jgi:hypothetical protein
MLLVGMARRRSRSLLQKRRRLRRRFVHIIFYATKP